MNRSLTALAAILAAIAPMAYAAGASPATPRASTAYSVQFTDAHGHVALKARVIADTGTAGNFQAEKDVSYVKEVVSGQPITPASLGVVKTGVWGNLLPAKHDLVAVSIRVATLKSMSELHDPSISAQPIQLPNVVGRTLNETVHLPAGGRVSIPIGLHGAGGTLTIARIGVGSSSPSDSEPTISTKGTSAGSASAPHRTTTHDVAYVRSISATSMHAGVEHQGQ